MIIKLYFATNKYFGEEMELSPRVPESVQEDEDNKVKRICVSASISGALGATFQNLQIGEPTFIYYTEIESDSKFLKQPLEKDVYDVAYTGEFWLTKKSKFKICKLLEITKDNSVYVNNIETHICNFKEIFVR